MKKLETFTFDPYINDWWIKCKECGGHNREVWDILQHGRNVNLKLSCGHILGFTNSKKLEQR